MATAVPVRHPRPPARAWRRRIASAGVLLPAFAWVALAAPPGVFAALVVTASAGASWELARLCERAGRATFRWLGVGATAAVSASFLGPAMLGAPAVPSLVLTVVVGVVMAAPLITGGAAATERAATTLLRVLYAGWLLGHAVPLHALPAGPALVLFLTGVTWVGETLAYVVGSALGRRPLAPVVSPAKTVEGAAAQGLGSVVTALGLGAWLLPECGVGHHLLLGLLLGVVGQLGDLAESALKRDAGAKDAGSLIPGHGGVLDRVDSLFFNVPVVYAYATLVGCGR